MKKLDFGLAAPKSPVCVRQSSPTRKDDRNPPRVGKLVLRGGFVDVEIRRSVEAEIQLLQWRVPEAEAPVVAVVEREEVVDVARPEWACWNRCVTRNVSVPAGGTSTDGRSMITLASIGRKGIASFFASVFRRDAASGAATAGVGVGGGGSCAMAGPDRAQNDGERPPPAPMSSFGLLRAHRSAPRLGVHRHCAPETHEIFSLRAGSSRTSRTLRARASGVKGFDRKAVPGGRMPWCAMAASV